jgi:hypothetical protein
MASRSYALASKRATELAIDAIGGMTVRAFPLFTVAQKVGPVC